MIDVGPRGHFRLVSGHHGDLWLDLDRLLSRPADLAPDLASLAVRLAPRSADVVCGPLTGGAFVAFDLAGRLGVDFAYEGGAVRSGSRVAVVDDAINAGSAVLATIAVLRAAGASVVAVGALLVLGTAVPDWCAAAGVPLEAVRTVDSSIWLPPDCPLCTAGVPLEDLTA